MHRLTLVASLLLVATTATAAELVLFEHDNFNGRRFAIHDTVNNLGTAGFNDKTSSVVVSSGVWQLCDDAYFRGRCITLRPGEYSSLRPLEINDRISSVRELSGWGSPPPAHEGGHWGEGVRVVIYEHTNFGGRSLIIHDHAMPNFADAGFNDRASSLRIEQGYWLFCSDAQFQGECLTFGPGEYATLPPELNNRISSARRISQRYPYNHSPAWGPGGPHSSRGR